MAQFIHSDRRVMPNHALQRTAFPPSVRASRELVRERAVRSTRAAAAVAELGSLGHFAPHTFMKALLTTLACITTMIVALSLTGCDHATAADRPASSGKPCTVQFRRDALGAAASLPISPMTGGINGADTAISCTYKSTREDWVIVERAGKELWRPKRVVLLIEFAP